MDELKMILDTLELAGSAGKEAFIWWLVFDKLLPIVCWLLTLGAMIWTAVWFSVLLSKQSRYKRFFQQWRELEILNMTSSKRHSFPYDLDKERDLANALAELQKDRTRG